ncbi:hypothetical protein ACFQ3W_03000 [Paenibacillus puldeungensis]|uniref:DUF3040 domain-containing protein n=1 Tax=Paenibacillus puldeungensis TaxID=696536 RepID=A0ABW3RSL3_9BACL
MDDDQLEKMLRSTLTDIQAPDHLKEKMLADILASAPERVHRRALLRKELFIYRNPLKISGLLSLAVSGAIWLTTGPHGIADVLSSWMELIK